MDIGTAAGADPYVTSDGNAHSPEPRQTRFATLEDARDAIRRFEKIAPLQQGSVTVWMEGGDHWLNSTFDLNEEDSGEADVPVIYWPLPGATVRLKANTRVDADLPKAL
ncbi:MAG: hypothetical protein RLZZ245_1663 [Verrucomicrobiota bacterium]